MWNVFAVIGVIAITFTSATIIGLVALIVYFACEDRRTAKADARAAVREAERLVRNAIK